MNAHDIVTNYYNAFNRQDWQAMLTMLTDDVQHDSNQGDTYVGKERFAQFLTHMDDCYDETLTELIVMVDPTGRRVGSEFVVNGTYKKTDGHLPEANGQAYVLPAGSFMTLTDDGLINRVTTYYNLPLWESMVTGDN
jgi:steroid delta-isomerase-like uncharacterized protein